jgi:hypothetical protein
VTKEVDRDFGGDSRLTGLEKKKKRKRQTDDQQEEKGGLKRKKALEWLVKRV